MKHAIWGSVILLISIAAVAVSQQMQQHFQFTSGDGFNVTFKANNAQRLPDLHIHQFKGNVEIRTRGMDLRADQATFNETTKEITASGVVHIKLEPQK